MTRTTLYRHYDTNNVLLYVGITDDLSRRDKEHQASSDWACDVSRTSTQWLESRDHAAALEAVAIAFERPIHNKCLQAPKPVAPEVVARQVGPCQGPKGPGALKVFLRLSGFNQTAFGEAVQCNQSTISKLVRGVKTPSLALATRIHLVTEGAVAVDDWAEITTAKEGASA